MKKSLLSLIILSFVSACNKSEKTTESESVNSTESASKPATDTLPPTIKSAENTSGFTINPIKEGADIGKAVFTKDSKVLFSFNTDRQQGRININGKDYALNHLNFTENNYEISGEGILITAENGNFQEMVSDCAYGTFPKVTVKFEGKEQILNQIKVQDCPNYH